MTEMAGSSQSLADYKALGLQSRRADSHGVSFLMAKSEEGEVC